VQGTLAAVRRVYRARVGDAVIAADCARVLAGLTGADWDPAWLALHLTSMHIPFPLQESSVWSGVEQVPADHWLCLERDGGAVTRRRWAPPTPELPLAEGARAVREAMTRAVEARTHAGGVVSTDLSGGLDSTSLAFLACRGPARVVTHHHTGRSPENDDTHYARLAARQLPGARHRVRSADEAGARFTDLGSGTSSVDTEEPYPLEPGRARLDLLARAMAEEGSRVHLVGLGGDELFRPGIAYLHDLVRSRPMTGLRQVRAQRLWDRLPWSAVLGPLAGSTSPARELALTADRLTLPRQRSWAADLGWLGTSLRMPPWATDHAADAARGLLREWAGKQVVPLSRRRGQHTTLLYARNAGKAVGRSDQLFARHGTRLAAPFLDDEVLHAALAVRQQDQFSPFRFKPLLTAAMAGVVPDSVLRRTTKGEYSAETVHDWARQRPHVVRFIEESELARRGLIDAERARTSLLGTHKDPTVLIDLHSTVVCEVWLRAIGGRSAAEQFPASRPASGSSEDRSP
jgi:asparagine synthase (glutamine-hydrolysing)